MSSQVLRQHPEILFNQTIKKTYKLIKLLGKGTFSVVYQCINLQTNQKVALKVGFPGQGQKMLNIQKKIYRLISATYGNSQRGITGFAKYYQFGKTQKFNFMVFERLSVSLEDIFLKLDHKFSIKAVLNIGLQGIQLIEKVHKLGYLHRDIKPSNFVLGHGNKKDRIFLIDFGLVRKIGNNKNQKNSQENQDSVNNQIHELGGKQFVGTKRFASIASHLGLQQSKKDDLESLGYTLIFLLKGRLPWQGIKLSSKFQKHQTIGKIKQDINLQQFCKLDIKDQLTYPGDVFLKLFRYLRALNFGDTPNYEFLKKIFVDQINNIQKKPVSNGFNRWRCKGKFDWMDEAEEQMHEKDDKQIKQDEQSIEENKVYRNGREERNHRQQKRYKQSRNDRERRHHRQQRRHREERHHRQSRNDRYHRQSRNSKKIQQDNDENSYEEDIYSEENQRAQRMKNNHSSKNRHRQRYMR